MKRLLGLLILLMFFVLPAFSEVVSYKDGAAQNKTKPMLVLVHASWAEKSPVCLTQFKNIQSQFGDSLNYVELDVASSDMKEFNAKYPILQNVPYMLMLRSNGMVSRVVISNCIEDYACVSSKIKDFIP